MYLGTYNEYKHPYWAHDCEIPTKHIIIISMLTRWISKSAIVLVEVSPQIDIYVRTQINKYTYIGKFFFFNNLIQSVWWKLETKKK